jgi:hypothetical protein
MGTERSSARSRPRCIERAMLSWSPAPAACATSGSSAMRMPMLAPMKSQT